MPSARRAIRRSSACTTPTPTPAPSAARCSGTDGASRISGGTPRPPPAGRRTMPLTFPPTISRRSICATTTAPRCGCGTTPGRTATTPAPDAAATTPATRWIYRTTGSGRISKRATPTPRPASYITWRTTGFISRCSPRRRPRVKRGTSRPRRRCSRSAITTTPFSPATRSCTRSIITRRCADGRWRTGAECTSARASRYCRSSSAAAGCSRKNTSPATSAPKPTRPCAPSSRSRDSCRTASRAAARSTPCSAKSRAPATRPRPS